MKTSKQGIPLRFGAIATLDGIQTNSGIIDDDGSLYMSGLPAQGAITVRWAKLPIKFVISVTSLPNNKLTLRLREWMPYADNLWRKMRVITTTIFCRRLNAMVRSNCCLYRAVSYHSGNPYIGVNFGVKTLDEEENTAGVVKDKFYQWNESNDYYVSCDCDKDNVRSGRWAFAADSPLVYLGDNWYKINDYLAAKVLLQVKGSSPTAVPFENVGTGQIHDGIFAIPRSTFRWPGASGNSGSFSLKYCSRSLVRSSFLLWRWRDYLNATTYPQVIPARLLVHRF